MTPGQVAFECFARQVLSATAAREWRNLPDHVRLAWEVVAADMARRKGGE